MLARVTITGADDQVDPRALVDLSARFPFVEWGIFFSTSRAGQLRYPTEEWIWSLARAVGRRPVQLAAHFCGACARETLSGARNWSLELPPSVDRIQLNGYEELTSAFCGMVSSATSQAGPEYILQAPRRTSGRGFLPRSLAVVRHGAPIKRRPTLT